MCQHGLGGGPGRANNSFFSSLAKGGGGGGSGGGPGGRADGLAAAALELASAGTGHQGRRWGPGWAVGSATRRPGRRGHPRDMPASPSPPKCGLQHGTKAERTARASGRQTALRLVSRTRPRGAGGDPGAQDTAGSNPHTQQRAGGPGCFSSRVPRGSHQLREEVGGLAWRSRMPTHAHGHAHVHTHTHVHAHTDMGESSPPRRLSSAGGPHLAWPLAEGGPCAPVPALYLVVWFLDPSPGGVGLGVSAVSVSPPPQPLFVLELGMKRVAGHAGVTSMYQEVKQI